MSRTLELKRIESVADRVHRLVLPRPEGFDFAPGQATELTLDRDGWRDEPRPFTMTSLPSAPELEFHIKSYPDHDGVTEQIGTLSAGARVTIDDAWGAIEDRGDGLFLAGGMGITPWLAILRARAAAGTLADSTLIYGVETRGELVAAEEFAAMEGLRLVIAVSEDPGPGEHAGRIDADLIARHLPKGDAPVYLCGPPPMEEAMAGHLETLGVAADRIVREE